MTKLSNKGRKFALEGYETDIQNEVHFYCRI